MFLSLILPRSESSFIRPHANLTRCESTNRTIFTRCELGNENITFDNYIVKAIYSYPESTGNVDIRSWIGAKPKQIPPGNISIIHGTPITISCSTNKCYISLWIYEKFYINQFYTVNSAGGVFTLKNETLSETYNCLFDFGEHTRAVFSEITHTRVGTAVSISYYDETARKIVQIGYDSTEKASVEFNSPGMMEIRDSAYEPISVSAVIGSTQKVKYPFTNQPKTGVAPVALFDTPLDLADKSLLKIANPTKEKVAWSNFQLIMISVSGLVFLIGLIIIIGTVIIHKKKHQSINKVSRSSSDVEFNPKPINVG